MECPFKEDGMIDELGYLVPWLLALIGWGCVVWSIYGCRRD
jgi:hypothetical protein